MKTKLFCITSIILALTAIVVTGIILYKTDYASFKDDVTVSGTVIINDW